MKFHLNRFLRRVRIHGGEFDTSARAMYRDEVVYPLQADLRIVRRSTIERKQMSTKTTFKRIALVAVAALGFGVLSVVPSQADVSGLEVIATNGNATNLKSDSTTAAVLSIKFLALAGKEDSVTVSIVQAAALPAASTGIAGAGIFWTESTTSTGNTNHPLIDTATVGVAGNTLPVVMRDAIYANTAFRVKAPVGSGSDSVNGTYSVKVKFSLGETTTSSVKAGTYSFNAIVGSNQAGVRVTQVVPFNIVVTDVVAATPIPAAGSAKAYLQAGASPTFSGVLSDSVTTGSLIAGTVIGKIQVSNFTSADAVASDTITVKMTGSGYLVTAAGTTGREFTVLNEDVLLMEVKADGSSGTGTITITTEKGASFVKTVTFYDQKPTKAVATVAKAYIKAGTGSVADVFSVVVTDTAGSAITNAVVSATATDTATTVGGAATCGTYDTTDKVYYCAVKGLSTTKFGPVAYTIKATGQDAAATVVSTSATTTFADNVATKAVLTGPASAAPGAAVEYTITLTEKNGYPVADQVYGAGVEATGGVLFATRVATGWTTAPFATTDSFTAKSGVITSEGTMPIAGTGTGTWTLVGDGLQTLAANAIDKTIGKTTLTVSTAAANAAADAATAAGEAATAAAELAEAAAQDATDAALDATEAATLAGALAQEAVDAVAELSTQVATLIDALKKQITTLTNLVIKIQKKVKA